jgi:hypothetical protein
MHHTGIRAIQSISLSELVRALCAQIALELDPLKAEGLVIRLKRALNGDYETVKATPETVDPLA